MTLRVRLALALAALAGASALVVGIAAYVATDQRVRAEIDDYLAVNAARFDGPDGRVAEVLCRGAGERPIDRRPMLLDDRIEGVVIQCLDGDGVAVSYLGTTPLPVNERDRAIAASGRGGQLRTADADGEVYRIRTVGVAPVGAVQIGRDYGETQRVLGSLRTTLVLIVIAAVGVGAAAGWIISRRATRPLTRLTDAAEEVASTGRLDVELPDGGADETGRLARAFAVMLAALGRSRDQQQQLVQDAGHELRTPLTSLRTNVETLQRYPDLEPSARRAILQDLDSETRELAELVDELVELATYRRDAEPVEIVELGELVTTVVERARRRSGRRIDLGIESATGSMLVEVRPRQIARAVGNLVDNALKFSSEGATVEITVESGTVRVADRGPGVDPIDRPHVFERFYRSAAARSEPGSGLGLAIVDQIARDHGGSVRVEDRPGGGAVFALTLPVTD